MFVNTMLFLNPQKFADIAEFMGEKIDGLSVHEAAEKAIDAMFRLSREIGIHNIIKRNGN